MSANKRRLFIILNIVLQWINPLQAKEQNKMDLCQEISFENKSYVGCVIDPELYEFHLKQSMSYKPASAYLKELVKKQNNQTGLSNIDDVEIVMNAGMYLPDMSPVGLYIEKGKVKKRINRNKGSGNFHMLPNGVFYIDNNKPAILDTESYVAQRIAPEYASQSGPMLVIRRKIHPFFQKDGKSRKIRNGVGITEDNKVIFVISKDSVSFGQFARLFLFRYKCSMALYFDGTISALFSKTTVPVGGYFPVGPYIVVQRRR